MTKKVLMKKGPYEIRAAGDNKTELLIYGDIGDSWYAESVTAKDVVTQLQEITSDEIIVRINSYGGSVSDGMAIFNALKRHDALVTVLIEGVAYSIASLIAMAGDTIEMAENTLMMIHAPWGMAAGNSNVMREYADVLDKYAEVMANSYVNKSGQSHDDIMALLIDGKDHYYNAEEAKAAGFVDVITGAIQIAASGYDPSRYQRYPAAAAAKPQPQQPATPAATNQPDEETTMTEEEKKAAAKAEADKIKAAADAAAAQALADDKERKTGIRAAFKPFLLQAGVQALLDTVIDDHEISIADANAKLLAHIGKDTAPLGTNPHIDMGLDAREKFVKGAGLAIAIRAGLEKNDSANEFRGYSLLELARQSLAFAGVESGRMDKMTLVAAAFTHGTSDFPLLLANNANKAMLKGYDEAEETFQAWTSPGELPDFKAGSRVVLNDFPSLREVKEGAEYKYITVGERGESIVLATYGEKFSITRQAIINDDLQSFVRLPMKMGGAAIRTVGDLVYAVLTTNGNMADGVALFHTTHANLLSAATIYTASVDAMRVAMAKQNTGGKALNIRLANLIVPVALEGVGKVARESEFEVGSTSTTKANTVPNSVRGTFEVISDARLDADSATAWYGTANSGMHDTIEVAYLDGIQVPTLEQQNGWDVDGVEFKVRLDAGVSPLDYRTMAKNPGS